MYTLQEPDHGKRRYVLVKMRPNIAMATHSNAIKRYWKPTPVSWIKNETFTVSVLNICRQQHSGSVFVYMWRRFLVYYEQPPLKKSAFLLWAVYDTRRTSWVAPTDSLQLLKTKTLYSTTPFGMEYLIQFVTSLNNIQANERKETKKYCADRSKLSSQLLLQSSRQQHQHKKIRFTLKRTH